MAGWLKMLARRLAITASTFPRVVHLQRDTNHRQSRPCVQLHVAKPLVVASSLDRPTDRPRSSLVSRRPKEAADAMAVVSSPVSTHNTGHLANCCCAGGTNVPM